MKKIRQREPKVDKRWIPVKRGRTYCSPACGGGCTIDAYNKALSVSGYWMKVLGGNWRTRVYENLGWHWCLYWEHDGFFISLYCDGEKWWTMAGPSIGIGTPGIYDTNLHPNPWAAIEATIKALNRHRLDLLKQAEAISLVTLAHKASRTKA